MLAGAGQWAAERGVQRHLTDPALRALCRRMFAEADRGLMASLLTELARIDLGGRLGEIRCPTLVLCGRQDQLTPLDCHMELAAGIANARLVVLEDCGHLAPMERPEVVTDALRAWLKAK